MFQAVKLVNKKEENNIIVHNSKGEIIHSKEEELIEKKQNILKIYLNKKKQTLFQK